MALLAAKSQASSIRTATSATFRRSFPICPATRCTLTRSLVFAVSIRRRFHRVDKAARIGPCVAGVGKFICIGLNYSDHAAESKMAVPAEPILVHESDFGDLRAKRRHRHPARVAEDRLGGRARRCHRQDGEIRDGVGRVVARRGLLRRQRSVRARVSARRAPASG